jgi:hypothetical protein
MCWTAGVQISCKTFGGKAGIQRTCRTYGGQEGFGYPAEHTVDSRDSNILNSIWWIAGVKITGRSYGE